MNAPYLETLQTREGWQATFALQIFHRPSAEWLAMRWGFNAGALLDEALDRYKLFLESQSLNETTFLANDQPAERTLALRAINLPGQGVQMAFLGKANAPEKAIAQQAARDYAREILSTFPHDFIVQIAEEKKDHDRLFGRDFFAGNPQAAAIQRAAVPVPSLDKHPYISGVWQSSQRANEQIWRALSNTRKSTMLNITMQPSILFDGEKKMLLDAQENIAVIESNGRKMEENYYSAHIMWAKSYVKRRLASWKKFFQLQLHVLADGTVDENLLRSIGSVITRDANENTLPGFQTLRPNSREDEKKWCEQILSLDFVAVPMHINDMADVDEAFAVFRLPYLPEAGLPGASFISAVK